MTSRKILILGVGNTIRSDDGAGAYACDIIEEQKIRGVFTQKIQQLQTEIIDTFLEYDFVLIADASVEVKEVVIKKVAEILTGPISSSHHSNAAMLLAIAKKLYQAEINLYTCAIPAENFDVGEELTKFAKKNADEAVEKIMSWVNIIL